MPNEFDSSNFLSSLSDHDLLIETKAAIKTEREATAVVVRYFKEINERELYLKHACSSLFQFATEKLGYCTGSAQLRINAMRLIEALPETEQKIESGELSLTAAAKVQTFIMLEKKAKRHVSTEEKREIVNACMSKSTREVERELAKRNPEIAKIESVKPVGPNRFQLSFSISEETEQKMTKLKAVLAHTQPNITTEELFETLIELGLEKFDPARKAARSIRRNARNESKPAHSSTSSSSLKNSDNGQTTAMSAPAVDTSVDLSKSVDSVRAEERQSAETTLVQVHAHEIQSARSKSVNARETQSAKSELVHAHETPGKTSARYIPARTKHQVWMRNQNRGCEFANERGERCGSKHALQVDHVHGFALGGAHDLENLRIICAKHNRFVCRTRFSDLEQRSS